MVNKIVWTEKATNQVENILLYISKEVSEQSATAFLDTLMTKVKSLEANTYEGRLAPKMRTVRFVLIGKNHRLYYRRSGNTLFITQLYDTRQDPSKSPYIKR
jgi:plasmid stabilization system protein ParE